MWTKIDGSKGLPEGTWVVELQEERLGSTFHVATKSGNVVFVACCFQWDMPPIIAYAPIPERH